METHNESDVILQPDESERLLDALCESNGANAAKSWKQVEARLFPNARPVRRAMGAAVAVSVGIVIAMQILSPGSGFPGVDTEKSIAFLTPNPPKTAKLGLDNGSNTVTTPRSGQYQKVLPDGTKVWLNNDSRLVYPVLFTGKERTVELTGEAYFEVAKDPEHPFRVKTGEMAVEVLGTSFNIMAYPEESTITTTLLQGSLEIIAGAEKVPLTPGEQSVYQESKPIETFRVQESRDTSWINGSYHFNANVSLRSVLNQLARWYNVDIEYRTDSLPSTSYQGGIDRNTTLQTVLDFLKGDNKGVHFLIEGKKIVVTQ